MRAASMISNLSIRTWVISAAEAEADAEYALIEDWSEVELF